MAQDFDITYPQKGRIKFSGGKNNKYDKQYIADNESPDMLNVILGDDSIETRGGSTKVNTTAVGSMAGQGLYVRHNNNGAQSMCAWFNGTLHVLGTTTFITQPSALSIYTTTKRVCATEYENYIFFGQEGNIPYKYNGDFTRHGVYAPTSTLTAGSGATGVLTGDYRYLVTYVNSNVVQSDVSPISTTLTVTSGAVTLTSIPLAPASYGVNSRKIYRTVTSGAVFKYLGEIADNTTTTYSDNAADSALGATAPTDQGNPPNYSFAITHQNRIFCNDPTNLNFVYYSELGDPYTFKATNFLMIGDNTTDLVRGLAVYNDNVVVFCDNSIWLIYMASTDPTDWKTIKIKSAYGCKSPYGSFVYNNKLMFPAWQNGKMAGFAALSGTSTDSSVTLLTTSAMGSDLKSNMIEPDTLLFADAYVDKISSIVYKNKAYISVPYGITQTTNNRIYLYDFSVSDILKKQEGAWIPWTGINAQQFAEFNGGLYSQTSTANGFVYALNSSLYSDDGTAIDSYYWTKEFSGIPGNENWTKDWRLIELLYEKSGDYYMLLAYLIDSGVGVGTSQTLSLNPGGSLWGTMLWGVHDWGGGQSFGESRISLGQCRGKRIQLKFSNQNTINQKFKVLGLRLNYNLKGRR